MECCLTVTQEANTFSKNIFFKIEHSKGGGGGVIFYLGKCSGTHDYTFDDLKTKRKAGITNFLSAIKN
jgi:hypothetical protein